MRTGNQNRSLGFGVVIAFITGLVSFLANLLTVLNDVKLPQISIGPVSIDIPTITINTPGILTNPSFAFATMIYSSVALTLFSQAISDRFHSFILSCLPSILLVFWAARFFSHRWWVIYPCLIASSIWMAIFLRDIDRYSYLSNNYLSNVMPVLMWPTIALILVYTRGASDLWAWIFSTVMLIVQFVIMKVDR
ncbi:MAG: hypothetical protein ACREEM_30845 [Blastocatellia bacterium]